MNQRDDLDRMLSAWLDDPYTPPTQRILGKVLERTRRTRQRPAWASLERWLPMTVITRPALSPPLRLAWLLLVGLLTLALATSVAIVGSRLLTSPGPDSGLAATFPVPQGPEAVIAFSTVDVGPEGQQPNDVYTVRADGTDMRQLTSGPELESHPVWSPDGTLIAYRIWQDGTDSVAVMDAGGGQRVTLATNEQSSQECVEEFSLAWSPDGTSLIFPTRDGCQGDYDLNIVAADGSSPATRLLEPGTNGLYPEWSRDGTRIAFMGSGTGDGPGLYLVDVAPGGAISGGLPSQQFSAELAASQTALEGAPRWSPDGTKLAVGDASQSVHVLQADGSEPTLTIEDALNPTWSPDGRQLAFQRTVDPSEYFDGRPCTVRTWVVDADGTDERRLDELGDGCDFGPAWSPDGTRLMALLIDTTYEGSDQYPFHLYVVTLDGSSPLVTLPDTEWATWQPVAAPLPPAPVSHRQSRIVALQDDTASGRGPGKPMEVPVTA